MCFVLFRKYLMPVLFSLMVVAATADEMHSALLNADDKAEKVSSADRDDSTKGEEDSSNDALAEKNDLKVTTTGDEEEWPEYIYDEVTRRYWYRYEDDQGYYYKKDCGC